VAAERRPGSDRGRPALDWSEAFLFYAGLPAIERSYGAVADEFGVSLRTVERHGRDERWRERALEIDRQATATAAARLADQRAATLADLEKLVGASFVGYAQMLREGKIRLGAADLPRLHKLLRELWAEPELRSPEPNPPPPPAEGLDPVEHKLQVLRGLHAAGVFQPPPQPGDTADADADADADRDREREGADELPGQDGGSR